MFSDFKISLIAGRFLTTSYLLPFTRTSGTSGLVLYWLDCEAPYAPVVCITMSSPCSIIGSSRDFVKVSLLSQIGPTISYYFI